MGLISPRPTFLCLMIFGASPPLRHGTVKNSAPIFVAMQAPGPERTKLYLSSADTHSNRQVGFRVTFTKNIWHGMASQQCQQLCQRSHAPRINGLGVRATGNCRFPSRIGFGVACTNKSWFDSSNGGFGVEHGMRHLCDQQHSNSERVNQILFFLHGKPRITTIGDLENI